MIMLQGKDCNNITTLIKQLNIRQTNTLEKTQGLELE